MEDATRHDCLTESEVVAFFAGLLPVEAMAGVERHLDRCAHCNRLVEAAAPLLAGAPSGTGAPLFGPTSVAQPGELLANRYRIEALIGWGASGSVFRVRDEVLDALAAVKLLGSEKAAQPAWLERLTRELRVARALNHPHVCRIFDLVTGPPAFLVMELAEHSLRLELREGNVERRPLDDRLRDAAGLAAGLAAMHDAGILHRDLKPENLLRLRDGRLVLSDFGLATLAPGRSAMTLYVGTPLYMAPELLAGEPADRASDIWSLGVVLHELVFGHRPRWEQRAGRRALVPPRVAGARERRLLRICRDCLRDARDDRPSDAAALAARFAALHRPARTLPSRRQALALAAPVVAGAAVGLSIKGWGGARTSDGPRAPTPVPWLRIASSVSFAPRERRAPDERAAPDGPVMVALPPPLHGIDLVDGDERTHLRDSGGDPALGPGGRSCVYVDTRRDNGAVVRALLHFASGGPDRLLGHGISPSWSADGVVTYFDEDRKIVRGIAPLQEGARPFDVYTRARSKYPVLSRDGRMIAFGTGVGIAAIDLASDREVHAWELFTGSYLRLAWSPDQDLMAFAGVSPHDELGLWVLSWSRRRALLVKDGRCASPAWSPSGDRLAFDVREGDGPTAVWQIGHGDIVAGLSDGLTEAQLQDHFAGWRR